MTFRPGDVVTVLFPGADKSKRRPAVVITTDLYHATRPDVLVSALSTQLARATAPTDYVLQDWQAAGLRLPSAFRLYVVPYEAHVPTRIGHVSDRDWAEIQARLRLGLAVA